MENTATASQTTKKIEAESSKTVISIFSGEHQSESFWSGLIGDLFESLKGWVQESTRILDANASNGGRVAEVWATPPYSRAPKELTLEYCSSIRKSQDVQRLEQEHDVEIIIQPASLYVAHKTPGLAVFDMDSTLIQQEVIDELARSVGRYEQVATVTEAAMRGELNFEESLRARVAKLDGVSTDIWEYMKANIITFMPGATELVKALGSLGWKTAVLSGGFTPLAYWVKDTLGLNYAYANQLATDDTGSKLTGNLLPDAPVVGPNLKRDTLIKLAAENSIPMSHTIAVGDGSNDLLMIQAAGMGIAFNAKPKVQAASPARLNSQSLKDVLHVLGYTSEEIASLL